MKKILRILIKVFLIFFTLTILFTLYSNSLISVSNKTVTYYEDLKKELEENGYSKSIYVISGKRFEFFNSLLAKYGNAVKTSRHLKGEAIDIIVFDVNNDGESNSTDVDIVYQLLDKKIIKDNGGIGTYKKKNSFFSRQMVHFDCRGYKARWHR